MGYARRFMPPFLERFEEQFWHSVHYSTNGDLALKAVYEYVLFSSRAIIVLVSLILPGIYTIGRGWRGG